MGTEFGNGDIAQLFQIVQKFLDYSLSVIIWFVGLLILWFVGKTIFQYVRARRRIARAGKPATIAQRISIISDKIEQLREQTQRELEKVGPNPKILEELKTVISEAKLLAGRLIELQRQDYDPERELEANRLNKDISAWEQILLDLEIRFHRHDL